MDLSPLNSKAAEALIGAVAEYPNTLRLAARDHAPHILCYYLKDLAAAFHAFYNAERVLVDDAVECPSGPSRRSASGACQWLGVAWHFRP